MNKEELEKKIDILDDEIYEIWEKSFDMPIGEGWKWYSTHPKIKERADLYRELKLIMDYKLSDFLMCKGKPVGDLMTLSEFVNSCKIGPLFCDSDGFGYYATKDQESNIEIYPSDIISGKYRKDFTHVMWYNK